MLPPHDFREARRGALEQACYGRGTDGWHVEREHPTCSVSLVYAIINLRHAPQPDAYVGVLAPAYIREQNARESEELLAL